MVRRSSFVHASLLTVALACTLAGCTRSGDSPRDAQSQGTAQLVWETDNLEALRLNARACALIDRYDSGREEAIQLLRKAVDLAPDWLPPRINLAIALLNQNKPETLGEAEQILREILKHRDDVPHAHFCLGIILNHAGKNEEAARHFRRVVELDPADPFAWYWLGDCIRQANPDEAEKCFRKAIEYNPYMRAALYGLQQVLSLKGRMDEALEIMKRIQELDAHKADQKAGIVYDEMGPYAYAVGGVPFSGSVTASPPVYSDWAGLKVTLRQGVRWTNAEDFRSSAELQAIWRLYEQGGFPWASLDYDGDGDQDLLLLGVVWANGQPSNVLLRNDGGGGFTDVTEQAGIPSDAPALAVAVGDYDNDLLPDVYICNAGPNVLLRNAGGRFERITASADVTGGDRVSTGAVFVDLDQDADLDLYVANLCSVADLATAIERPASVSAVESLVLLNTGRPASVPQKKEDGEHKKRPVPLSTEFQQHTAEPLCYRGPLTAVTFTDIDNDRDVDLLVVRPDGGVVALRNDRVLKFEVVPLEGIEAAPHARGAVLVIDFDLNDIRDLVLGGEKGVLYVGKGNRKLTDYPNGIYELAWERSTLRAGRLWQMRAVDIDLDGRWEAVGLLDGQPVWIGQGPRGVIQVREGLLPSFSDEGTELAAYALVSDDFDGDGIPELLGFVPGKGLIARKAQGNGNHWVKLRFTGVRDDGEELRTTADAVGTRYLVHAGGITVIDEIRPVASGGASVHGPVTVGIGRSSELDGLRIRWPDNMIQGEVGLAADQLHVIQEIRRKSISCPVLFTWNGERYEYVCDFLGGGGLGYMLRPGEYNPPDPDEVLRITDRQLKPTGGRFRIAIAEPMDEVCYLDALRLTVVDHLDYTVIYPDERFAPPGNRATGKPLCFRQRIYPHHAEDHHGHDVTEQLQRLDRSAVDDFQLLSAWPGYAEDHYVVLTFNVPEVRAGERLYLCLGGWVEYAFSDTNYAAYTAGVELKMPSIDLQDDNGQWREIVAVAGIPAGSPRTMTVDLTGRVPTGKEVRLRVRTNVQVYWDEAFLGVSDATAELRTVELRPTTSKLIYRGHLQEFSPDGRWPTEFDYARTDPTPLVRQFGLYTRYGEVNELLETEDDAFVIFGAGDALEIEFDAVGLPPLPDGWRRTYLLRAVGFCKSADPLTLHPLTVGPLPFRGMKQYPPGPGETPADPDRVQRLHRKYNTRYHGPPQKRGALHDSENGPATTVARESGRN